MNTRQVAVAIVGSGDLARYLVEEFARHGQHKFHIIARSKRAWFSDLGRNGQYHLVNEYSRENFVSLMNEHEIDVIASTIYTEESTPFMNIHEAMLSACHESKMCKRLIPSDYSGDAERFPDLPRFYRNTRHRFRNMLAEQSDIEWTSVGLGWLMDYFVHLPSGSKTYIKEFSAWPLDCANRIARIPGTGHELVSFTAARDVAKAVVCLVGHPRWDRYTYVCGETTSWEQLVPKLEKLYGFEFKREYISLEDIEKAANDDSDPGRQMVAFLQEFDVSGAGMVPMDVATRQKNEYFDGIKFSTVEELIRRAQAGEIV